MDNNLAIKEVTIIDEALIESLADLLIKVVQNDASIGFILPLSKVDAIAYWQTLLNDNIILWIATIEGQLCGTIQLHLVNKPNGSHRCEVAKLMVSPNFCRRGIGRKLMLTLEQRAIDERRTLIVMDTRQGDPSNRLYQSLGYIQAGQIPNFARSIDGKLEPTVFYFKQLE